MNLFRRGALLSAKRDRRSAAGSRRAEAIKAAGAVILVLVAGCASPGPPRSPSLHLPEPVSDLAAHRVGDVVELSYTAPWRSTDKLPLRAKGLDGVICRELERQACLPVAGFTAANAIATTGPKGGRNLVTWRDPLPAGLASGPRRLLSYRVEFFNKAGRSAGKSEAAYTAAGAAPAPVEELRAEGSRLGIVLRWRAAAGAEGTVVLRREDLTPAATPMRRPAPAAAPRQGFAKNRGSAAPRAARIEGKSPANVVWLETDATSDAVGQARTPPQAAAAEVLDTTAEPDARYRYAALRQITLMLGGRSIELRSTPSAPIEFTLRGYYPPPAPTELTAAGYATAAGQAPAGGGFAVDLIWQPVDAAGLIAPFAGYNVYRAAGGAEGAAGGPEGAVGGAEGAVETGENGSGHYGKRLNSQLVQLPAFRDTTADPGSAYRYAVTSVDSMGNESRAATTVLQPSQKP